MPLVNVVERRQESEGVISLTLSPPPGETLPSFDAGAHIDLVADGITRQYSLCGDPARPGTYRIGVLLSPTSRGGSAWVHQNLVSGMQISVSAPRNLFALDESLTDYVLLAGGIGITPILAMAWRLHALGKNFTLHYCVRSRDHASFGNEMSNAPFYSRVHYHFDDDPITTLDLNRALETPRASRGLYVCGPTGFMDHVFDAARQRGWSAETLHREDFGANPTSTDDDSVFTLIVKSTGARIAVHPGISAAQALDDAGYFVPTSCEQGICGSCLTPVLEGAPDHRDSFQTQDERSLNNQFTPCCSRALGDTLVIDI